MIKRYRKKPVEVEAIKFTDNPKEVYAFTNGSAKFNVIDLTMEIETKEGIMKAMRGDYVVKEPFPTGDRDYYPCKPDIFEQTYEEVE